MSRKRKDDLEIAKKFRDLLLWEITGGNMGKRPENPVKKEVATFGEKRGFLDSMIKIAALERKEGDEGEESGFDLIRSQMNAGRKNGRAGNIWAVTTKGSEPEPAAGSSETDSGENASS